MPNYDTDQRRQLERQEKRQRGSEMVEIGLAILFVSILVAADRGRYDTLNEKMRDFVDWLDRPEDQQ